MKNFKKILLVTYFLLFCFFANASDITSCFGIYYKSSYEEIKRTLVRKGFTIINDGQKKLFSNEISISVGSFEYEKIPYSYAIFTLKKSRDKKYYLSYAMGGVDTKKLRRSDFDSFVNDLKREYRMEDHNNGFIFFYSSNNDDSINIVELDNETITVSYNFK